jgi:hypothetical protein
LQKKRIEEALNQAKKNKIVRYDRPYDGQAGDWLYNALLEHRRLPFHAIIAKENQTGEKAVLLADDFDELHPLMKVLHDCPIRRDAESLSAAMKELLRFSSRILFVDAYYDAFNARYKSTFRECLGIVSTLNPNADCEIHYRYHDQKPTNHELEREAPQLFSGVIPEGMKVTIFCWRQKKGGEDFHARYLLTERGGIASTQAFQPKEITNLPICA